MMDDLEPPAQPEEHSCTMLDHDETDFVAVCMQCGMPKGRMKLHVRTFALRIPRGDDLPADVPLSERIAQSELSAYIEEHDHMPKCAECGIELRLGKTKSVDFGPEFHMTEVKILGIPLGRLSRVPARLRRVCLIPYVYDAHQLLYREALQ